MNIYIYPGSFNSLHVGHLAIAQYVEDKFQEQVLFEICDYPFDKNPVSQEDLAKRVKQFTMLSRPVITSHNVTFLEKSNYDAVSTYKNIFHADAYKSVDIIFIVGADTITRIDDIKYYCNSEREKKRAMAILESRGVKFLVFPRIGHLTDGLSPDIMRLCDFVTDFEPVDISSTEVREAEESKFQVY